MDCFQVHFLLGVCHFSLLSPIAVSCRQTGYLFSSELANADIIQVNYTDADLGDNAKATFRLVHDTSGDFFKINSTSGWISLAKDARLLDSVTNLTVNITDLGQPPLSSVGIVAIELERVNNTEPFFVGAPYSVNVFENLTAGSSVLKVFANDTDPKEAGQVAYSISNVPQLNGNAVFAINTATGLVTLEEPLDYEATKMYTFTVTATDQHKRRPKQVSTDITVTVDDVNDNSPVFNQSSYTFNVNENQTVGYTLIVLENSVTDADDGVNKALTFGVYSVDPSFSVDSSTGHVSVAKKLSRKQRGQHILYVYVTDGGVPQRRANVTIIIDVIEVNDVAPVIIVPATFTLEETNGTHVNVSFLRANISDQDTGPAGNVSLEIIRGDTTLFGVQEFGYGIFYKQPLDFEV